VVIDFIDMIDRKHKQVVEKFLKDSIKGDKAKIEIGRISKFGLLEMSRQRLKSSLASQSNTTCPQCEGRGKVLTPESDALEVLRKLQSSAFAGGVDEIRVHMAPSSALLLLNNQRSRLQEFEEKSNTRIIIFADGRKRTGKYELELHTARAEVTTVAPDSKDNSSRDRDRGSSSDRGSRRRSSQGRSGSGRPGGKSRSGGRRRSNNRGDRRKKPPRSKDSSDTGSGEASSAKEVSSGRSNEKKSSSKPEGKRDDPPARAS
jgi:ribonuclease E